MNTSDVLSKGLLWLAAVALPGVAGAGEASFEVYGFAQADYIQDFKRVNPNWDDTLRPSRIPTTEGQFGDDGQAIISVRQSRLGAQANLPVSGQDLYAKLEFDFFGVGVDEGQTTIRLRHAYGQWGQFLAGQTHSLFMDIDAFPNTIDYWGPAGMVFLRNPQIRWTPIQGDTSVAIAIEKPGNDIDAGDIRTLDPDLADDIRNDEEVPDFTAQYRTQGDWGHFLLGGILRRVGFETIGTPDNEPSDSEMGWGINASSGWKVGARDKLILAVVYGEGIASYMNDGGMDLAPDGTSLADASAKAVPLLGVSAYYDHYWNDQFSSSIGYSTTKVDNQGLQADDAFEQGQYASANLLYYPGKNMLVGLEALWGERQDNGGADGTDMRIQISFKYSFSSKDFFTAKN